jgi:glyoxylase I family protein
MEAIDHLDLVVSSLERSLPVYLALLAPLGFGRTSEIVGERGERVVYVTRPAGAPGAIGLREAQSHRPHDRYALGFHHLAFATQGREQVEEIAALARRLDLTIEGGPREYDYAPGYFAVFVHDPDGLKLEFVHAPR